MHVRTCSDYYIYTVNLLRLDMLSEGGDLPCKTPPCPLPIPQLHLALWNLFVLFMLCIFRIISNLIAISLLLPAAAARKIKSHPMKRMLG